MAKLRSVNILFWSDSYIEDLNPHGKLVFNYLLTNSLTQIGGFYKISVKKISDETGITREEISDLLTKFEDDKKIIYRDGWLVLRNSLRHQNLNPNMAISVVTTLADAPEWVRQAVILPEEVVVMVENSISKLKEKESHDKARSLGNALKALLNPSEALPNAYQTLSKGEGEEEGEEEVNTHTPRTNDFGEPKNSGHTFSTHDNPSLNPNDFTFPLRPLIEAFPTINLTPANAGHIEAEVKPGDEMPWAETITLYVRNHDPTKNSYLPEKVGTLLDVFKNKRKEYLASKNNGNFQTNSPTNAGDRNAERIVNSKRLADTLRQQHAAEQGVPRGSP